MPAPRSSPRQSITSATLTITHPLTPETILSRYHAPRLQTHKVLREAEQVRAEENGSLWVYRLGYMLWLYVHVARHSWPDSFVRQVRVWCPGCQTCLPTECLEYVMRRVLVWAIVEIYVGYRRKEEEKGRREVWAREIKRKAVKGVRDGGAQIE